MDKIKEMEYIDNSPRKRVDTAIYETMNIYCNKLANKFFPVGLEFTFQFNYARILEQVLGTYTLTPEESFQVLFEDNNPIDSFKDYVDIVVVYRNKEVNEKYFIELKYKKITDQAADLGNIESYKDMYMLDRHISDGNAMAAYYIFLTDWDEYTISANKGTRVEIPMYHNYTIEKDKLYIVTGKTAKSKTTKFPDGFKFSNSHTIKYTSFEIDKKKYWYYIEKI
ncbi:MAG: hypothetical protein IJ565_06410 [Bacilli bacterium]|nr:hypothetical protein [Bacilli bacterium]